jgi:hypothetical protein
MHSPESILNGLQEEIIKSMRLYRVDKRDFYAGDIVNSANEFFSLNPEGSNKVEEIFENNRPYDKPNRIGCLYLFENEVVAKKHWSKMADAKLYEVDFLEELILHRGDMRFVDKAFAVSELADKVQCAKDYWAGVETKTPRIEILVHSAVISRVISKDQAERRKYLLNWPAP